MYGRFSKGGRQFAVVTLGALLVSALAAPMAFAGEPSKGSSDPNSNNAGETSPNVYTLQGDASNSGTGVTNFWTTYGSAASGAWYFESTSATSGARSLRVRQTAAPGGVAIWGQGNGYGVLAEALQTGGYGVDATDGPADLNGIAIRGNGGGIGVYGISSDPDGSFTTGVHGRADDSGSAGAGYGVEGYGDNDFAGSDNYGVYGSATGPVDNTGVFGTANNGSGVSTGVYGSGSSGTTVSSADHGVFGTCPYCQGVTGTSSQFIGVRGNITGSNVNSYGGYFENTAGVGAYAFSTNYYGLFGGSQTNVGAVYSSNGNHGGYFAASCTVAPCTGAPGSYYGGVFESGNTNNAGYFRLNGTRTGRFAIVTLGSVSITDNFQATGTKSAVVNTNQGRRLMYATEATKNIFTDQGTARLVNGRAVINVDPLFAQTVSLDKGFQVFVTPNSADTLGLAVVNKTATGFEVRELNKGTGSFSFDWKIEGLRKGYEDVRMAPAPADPVAPETPEMPAPAPSFDAPVHEVPQTDADQASK